jgi:hypothetical protein
MSLDSKQNRVLEILVTSDESDDSVVITGIRYRRDGFGGTAFIPAFTAGAAASAAAGGHITAMGEQLPPFTHIKIIPTHQA